MQARLWAGSTAGAASSHRGAAPEVGAAAAAGGARTATLLRMWSAPPPLDICMLPADRSRLQCITAVALSTSGARMAALAGEGWAPPSAALHAAHAAAASSSMAAAGTSARPSTA